MQVHFSPLTENINYTPADEQFIIKLNNIIKENLDNSDLDAQFLVDKLCISLDLSLQQDEQFAGSSCCQIYTPHEN